MKELTPEPKVTCCVYVPARIKAALERWAIQLSTRDREATPGDAATQAIDALAAAKWKPGAKLKASK